MGGRAPDTRGIEQMSLPFDRSPAAGESRPRFLLLIIIALVLLRWWLGSLPGYPPDLHAYKQWALVAGTEGVHTIFDRSSYDYPPLYAYLLAPFGWLYATLVPGAVTDFESTRRFGDSALFSILVKIPPLAFDILLAFLLAALAWRLRLWETDTKRGWLPALLYLCLPPVLFNSGYWGQPDVVHTFSILLSLALILAGKAELGWVAAALACMMKPLAAPFLPLLACATLACSGWKRMLRGWAAGLAAALLVLAPFFLTGRGERVVSRLVGDVDLMPFASVNGHNLWWLLAPWKPAEEPWIGPITRTQAGLAIFALAYAAILLLVYRIERDRARGSLLARGPRPLNEEIHWFWAGGAVPWAFFSFSTHMHENHLFGVLPFLVLLAGRGRRWLALCALVALGVAFNMAVHDIALAEGVFRHWGGASSFFHPDMGRMLSRFEWWGSTLNSLVLLALLALFFVWGFRRRFDAGSRVASARIR